MATYSIRFNGTVTEYATVNALMNDVRKYNGISGEIYRNNVRLATIYFDRGVQQIDLMTYVDHCPIGQTPRALQFVRQAGLIPQYRRNGSRKSSYSLPF